MFSFRDPLAAKDSFPIMFKYTLANWARSTLCCETGRSQPGESFYSSQVLQSSDGGDRSSKEAAHLDQRCNKGVKSRHPCHVMAP